LIRFGGQAKTTSLLGYARFASNQPLERISS
jgi:hypothetical protein